jgi:hypothetical protein
MGSNSQIQFAPAPTPLVFAPTGVLQRKCDCGQHTIAGGECELCQKQKEATNFQRATQNSEPETRNSGGVPPIVHDVLNSPGQPLDANTRAFFEPRFGHDFSRVRVHTDGQAMESARSVGALAYTVGRDVVFGAEQYSPGTTEGAELLAHELTHVVQQSAGARHTSTVVEVACQDNTTEREAEIGAEAVMSAHVAPAPSAAPLKIARRDSPGGKPAVTPPAVAPATAAPRHACVKSEYIPNRQSGALNMGGRMFEAFGMLIDWEHDPARNCDCSCGEYRQYVRGHYIYNGKPLAKPLWGGAFLEEDVYHEDGDGKGHRYGHRGDEAFQNDVFDSPDRLTGCSYKGMDLPQIDGRGSYADVFLAFKGQNIDVCTNTFGKIHEWKVVLKGRIL